MDTEKDNLNNHLKEDENTNQNKTSNNKNNGIKIVLIVIIIVMAIIIGMLVGVLITKNNNASDKNKSETNQLQQDSTAENGKTESTDNNVVQENVEKEDNNVESKESKIFSQKDLEKMAQDYYEAKTGYRPSQVASIMNDDGTISIQLYDNLGDHNSTSDWYTVDNKTAVGTDILGNTVDLTQKPTKDKISENLKDSFNVKYETIGVRNITVRSASFVCNENVPHITGIDSKAANKIEKYLNDWYDEVWKDINEQTEDKYIKEILEQMDENNNNYPDSQSYDIGFTQSYEVIFINNKVVTFKHILSGGLGGVGWDNTSGVSFDLTTGEKINIENIVTSKTEYISACKKYVFEQLKNDSRYKEVLEMHGNDYEEIINQAIEQVGGYFTEKGIVCVEIPKYAIASGASGEFRYEIPYNMVKNYINNEFVF